jgi:hypothetical protein
LQAYPRHLQHVALTTATAIVFYRLTGRQVNGARSAPTMALLNDVAHAISNVVPVYIPDSATTFKALTPVELMQGQFERGGMIFRTKDGREHHGLALQRSDMALAISVLRAAKARFTRDPASPDRPA